MKHEQSDGKKVRWAVYALLAGSMALWGGTWPVGRLVAQRVAPWSAVLLRFTLATVALLLLCLRTGGRSALRVRPGLLPSLLLLGATGIFGYSFLFFSGLRTTESARAGLIVGGIPACIALGSSLLARRLPPPAAVGGILLSLLGVAVVVSGGDPLVLLQGRVRAGDLMILGCVVCWTAYTLLARPVMREISPLVALTWSCLLGTALTLPFALGGGLGRDLLAARPADWAGLAYLGVLATALGYYAYYHAIREIGPVGAGIFINLVPLFAVLFGCVFLDERVGSAQLLGGLMAIAGVVVTTGAQRRRLRSTKLATTLETK